MKLNGGGSNREKRFVNTIQFWYFTPLLQHLAMELADYNIRVNAVSAVVNTTHQRRFLWRSCRKGT
jgi:hypothetical protein